jgi:plasmid maintenance system killer protein
VLLVLFLVFFTIFNPPAVNYSQVKNTSIDVNIGQEVTSGKIDLQAAAGKVNVSGGAQQGKMIQGNLMSNVMGVETSSNVSNNIQSVYVVPKDSIELLRGEPQNVFSLKLANDIPLDFIFQGGAAELNIDLTSVSAKNVNIDTGASDLNLKLGNKVSSDVRINAGASSINITLPNNIGVMLTVDSGLSSKTLKGLVMESNKIYKTPNYDSMENKINIDISMGIASLNIDWQEIQNPKTKVQLFYYNQLEDKSVECGQDYVLPVEREIDSTQTPIQDTINLLIKGELTQAEKDMGFTTEFPNKDFKLLSANLKDGVLSLEFTEVPGFTTGGSCRVSILTAQIIKTAKQFPGVDNVILLPESIFQP